MTPTPFPRLSSWHSGQSQSGPISFFTAAVCSLLFRRRLRARGDGVMAARALDGRRGTVGRGGGGGGGAFRCFQLAEGGGRATTAPIAVGRAYEAGRPAAIAAIGSVAAGLPPKRSSLLPKAVATGRAGGGRCFCCCWREETAAAASIAVQSTLLASIDGGGGGRSSIRRGKGMPSSSAAAGEYP